jgi:hypothetical protein
MSSTHHRSAPDPIALTAVGVMITMGAFVALVVAGVTAAGLFPASGTAADAAADRGVWMATQAWANPVGLAGLAVLFAAAIPTALHRIRDAIDDRSDAMVHALPALITGENR